MEARRDELKVLRGYVAVYTKLRYTRTKQVNQVEKISLMLEIERTKENCI